MSLKNCRANKEVLESNYFKCEKELKRKTEEVDLLKIEVKDLKQVFHIEKEKLEEIKVQSFQSNPDKNNVNDHIENEMNDQESEKVDLHGMRRTMGGGWVGVENSLSINQSIVRKK